MPSSSNAINMCDVDLYMEDEGGNWVDISGTSNEVTLEFSRNIGEWKVFGDQWMQRKACGKDASLSINVIYTITGDSEPAEGKDLFLNWLFDGEGSRNFRLDMPSSETGNDRYEGPFVLESLPVGGSADEAAPVMMSMSMSAAGQVYYETIT
jgi:hypothetical protein